MEFLTTAKEIIHMKRNLILTPSITSFLFFLKSVSNEPISRLISSMLWPRPCLVDSSSNSLWRVSCRTRAGFCLQQTSRILVWYMYHSKISLNTVESFNFVGVKILMENQIFIGSLGWWDVILWTYLYHW